MHVRFIFNYDSFVCFCTGSAIIINMKCLLCQYLQTNLFVEKSLYPFREYKLQTINAPLMGDNIKMRMAIHCHVKSG